MNINEIKTLAEVGVTEIKSGCYRVTARKGYQLQIGQPETYTDEEGTEQTIPATVTDSIYMGEDADVQLTIVEDTDGGIATADENGSEVLTIEQRMSILEAKVGALEADAASAADGGEAMAIDDEL